jgi:hypothetical protein
MSELTLILGVEKKVTEIKGQTVGAGVRRGDERNYGDNCNSETLIQLAILTIWSILWSLRS